MAQWGDLGHFTLGQSVLEVIPCFDTGANPFNPVERESVIGKIVATHMTGPDAEKLLVQVEEKFLGKSPAAWAQRNRWAAGG